MKAAVRDQYGTLEVMSLTELPAPRPRAGEVLVELRATSLNLSDWEFLRGTPAYVRLWGLRRPRYRILGSDIAGRVVEVGPGVSKFRVGAEVFGDVQGSWGGFAELVCAHENMLTLKPESLSFEQVAAIPQAALVALQGLRRGGIAPGQRVLINGAGGGSGSFAVQIAKSFGAIVTGVDSAAKLESMRAVGADAVIDYAVADFAELGERYDLILDLAASRSLFEVRRALSPRGRYVLAGGSLGCLLQALLLGPLLSLFSGKKLALLFAEPNHQDDLFFIQDLVASGKLRPIIDRRFPLSEVVAALRYLGEGHARGKVVITM